MKRSTLVALSGTTLGLLGAAAFLTARKVRRRGPRGVLYREADQLTYRELMPGVFQAVLWGDPERGPHAAFTRFVPGVRHPLHTHTHDITLLVLEGAYLYQTTKEEIRVGPRTYFFIPGGTSHRSSGDPTEGALFYQESPGWFDLNILE